MHVLRNKWFWVSVVVLFILAVILEAYLLFGVVLKGLYLTKWHPLLLFFGLTSIVLGAIGAKGKRWESKDFRDMGKLLFFIAIFWTFMEYGITKSAITIAGILFLTKILKFFVPKQNGLRRVE